MSHLRAAKFLGLLCLVVGAGTGCVADVDSGEIESSAAGLDGFAYTPGTIYLPRDNDLDGLEDGEENTLLQRFAPVLYLPRSNDWTKPASVNWYLARTRLRFHHNNCGDCGILSVGSVTQSALLTQSHRKKNGLWSWSACGHNSTTVSSTNGPWDDNHHFFLQAGNDDVHRGATNTADWIVYGHAYPNTAGGIHLQYWFFYPYNDNFSSFNHEGDWESIIVYLLPDRRSGGVYFCGHGDCSMYQYNWQVTWFNSTHPMVWVADGSHASYPSEASCDRAIGLEGALPLNCDTDSSYRWFTWTGGRGTNAGYQGGGVINVGEREAPLGGQQFIRYYGQWGENGETDTTSGPRTPSFQASWNFGRAF